MGHNPILLQCFLEFLTYIHLLMLIHAIILKSVEPLLETEHKIYT